MAAASLNLKADMRVLRAEAQNALAPFLAEAMESLKRKHELDERDGVTRRHVNAVSEVRNLFLAAVDAERARIG
jgi:hypothetical protein